MTLPAQPLDPVKVPGYLDLLLELDALDHDRRTRPQRTFGYAWMLFGIFLGGWLVLQWA